MVSPETFGYNNETAGSNVFQKNQGGDLETIRTNAAKEFKAMVDTLSGNGVNVFVLGNDTEEDQPDAVFPNNWFTTHEDGTVILFPMHSRNRRGERDPGLIENILEPAGFKAGRLVDLSRYESEGLFLEGTGSLVIDRVNNCVYAAESERTSETVFDEYCNIMNIPKSGRIFFKAEDERGNPIYHTNVMMSVGNGFAVVCEECIPSSRERSEVINSLERFNIEVITINYSQLKAFCGNILNLSSIDGKSLIVMSETSQKAFNNTQLAKLEKYGQIIPVNIPTIETIGGGSARCMIAEIFLQNT